MLRKLAMLAVIVAVVGAAALWVVTIPATIPAGALVPYSPNLDNGKTMFHAGGCATCHPTPNHQDKTQLGGGLGLKTPFGTFFPPNISPDRDDGIGGWSEADFVTAMWKGTSPGGRHYYPVFPYTSYQRMKMEDARDLFAYLKTLPPVKGKTREHELPFYLNIRRMVGGWKFLFLDGEPFKPDPSKSVQLNRGAYLVNAAGHCAECHSTRNFLGAIISSPALRRRSRSGRRRRLGTQHHTGGNRRLLEKRRGAHPRNRRLTQRGYDRRPHGGGGGQRFEAFPRRSQRHRCLPQIAAAGPRPQASIMRLPDLGARQNARVQQGRGSIASPRR